jgi:hypothetical protein
MLTKMGLTHPPAISHTTNYEISTAAKELCAGSFAFSSQLSRKIELSAAAIKCVCVVLK